MTAALYILLLYINEIAPCSSMDTFSEYFYSEYAQQEPPQTSHKKLPLTIANLST